MKFEVNDYVVYPGHGIGRVTEVFTKELSTGLTEFYAIEIIGTIMKLKVVLPVKTVRAVGIKRLKNKSQVKEATKIPEFKRRYINHGNKAKI